MQYTANAIHYSMHYQHESCDSAISPSVQIRGGKCLLPSTRVIVAADGESAATETAASAAPMKVAVDACGRPVTFLEVIHEVEVSECESESAEFFLKENPGRFDMDSAVEDTCLESC